MPFSCCPLSLLSMTSVSSITLTSLSCTQKCSPKNRNPVDLKIKPLFTNSVFNINYQITHIRTKHPNFPRFSLQTAAHLQAHLQGNAGMQKVPTGQAGQPQKSTRVAAGEPNQPTAGMCPHKCKHTFTISCNELCFRQESVSTHPKNTSPCDSASNGYAYQVCVASKPSHKSLNHRSKELSKPALMGSGKC